MFLPLPSTVGSIVPMVSTTANSCCCPRPARGGRPLLRHRLRRSLLPFSSHVRRQGPRRGRSLLPAVAPSQPHRSFPAAAATSTINRRPRRRPSTPRPAIVSLLLLPLRSCRLTCCGTAMMMRFPLLSLAAILIRAKETMGQRRGMGGRKRPQLFRLWRSSRQVEVRLRWAAPHHRHKLRSPSRQRQHCKNNSKNNSSNIHWAQVFLRPQPLY